MTAVDESLPTDENKRQRKRQRLRLAAGVVAAGVIAVVAAFWVKPKATVKKNQPEPTFDTSASKGDPKGEWLTHGEARLTEHSEQIKALEQLLQTQHTQQETFQHNLQSEIQGLTQTLAKIQAAPASDVTTDDREMGTFEDEVPPLPTLVQHRVQAPAPSIAKTEASFVPAMSFVGGVLLNGIDVSTGVMSQSDPRPVVVRLTGDGSLPNGKHSQLKNCRVLGVAHGEISSERALIRLSKLSCWQLGEFREFPIKGYVTGHDGKPGIRGRVVMRDGALLGRAFVGGFIGGLAKSASNSLTFQSVSPEGSVSSVKPNNALGYAGADGVSDSFSMYAKYHIKRAEQYQPVIEVGSGVRVDVVFTDGFYLDGYRLGTPGTRENRAATFTDAQDAPPVFLPQPEEN